MAKKKTFDTSFSFGANAKPKKKAGKKKAKAAGKSGNAWSAYTGSGRRKR